MAVVGVRIFVYGILCRVLWVESFRAEKSWHSPSILSGSSPGKSKFKYLLTLFDKIRTGCKENCLLGLSASRYKGSPKENLISPNSFTNSVAYEGCTSPIASLQPSLWGFVPLLPASSSIFKIGQPQTTLSICHAPRLNHGLISCSVVLFTCCSHYSYFVDARSRWNMLLISNFEHGAKSSV